MNQMATNQLTPIQSFNQSINSDGTKTAIARVLPKHIEVETFISICQTAVLGNPNLLECNFNSIINAAMKCAEDQLLPDGRQAAFVPFAGICQYMPMVRGIMKRLKEQGEVTSIIAQCIYENDVFDYALGDNPHLNHLPKLSNKGEIIGVYAVFKKDDQVLHREVMNLEEITEIRKLSKAGNSPWKTFFVEMARKTVIRRGAKYVIHTEKMNILLERDNEFYDLVKPTPQINQVTMKPPSVAHLEFEKNPNSENEIQGQIEKAAPEPEVANEGDIPTNPETVLSNIKDDVERAQDMDDINNARDANHEDIKNLPDTYKKAANELFTARIDELEGAQ
ncbi:MAG: recombinase RecT [Hyphomicrobiales bacterium]